ncbi:cell division protein FtsX [Anoxynatronum buryatiense]|uniref:Cell division protein FtsX n=1 Tax=Anoxynatronum buryatiense TaxID=489973 RepID=A0AA45WTI5_9CLOT|nr:permease-like cell division protein FtsX [Anoxynatronum buryatiense]SMP43132.1 cell division protein FtsX [Anoxynatronum buryatiense]
MKRSLVNLGYFIREAFTLLKLNGVSHLLSFVSIALAFFLLSLVVSTWWVSLQIIDTLQQEAEISVFISEDISQTDQEALTASITAIPGVMGVRMVSETEAFEQMAAILGEEAEVLTYFDENPFDAYLETSVDPSQAAVIYQELLLLSGVRHIRDNREVLHQIQSLTNLQRVLGLLFIAAAGTATLVVISHLIRQGVYQNRNQIHTLKLLGAPPSFIALPFLMVGLGLTLGGGLLATLFTRWALYLGYQQLAAPLPFIPLPPLTVLFRNTSLVILSLSLLLGIAGSAMGLKASRIQS